MKNLYSILSALLIVFTISSASCQTPQKNTEEVTSTMDVKSYKEMLDNNKGVLLDVRTPEEFSEGHIPGAINIDYNAENFKSEIEKLDKSKQYNVYCRSGRRSAAAMEMMEQSGFNKVINLEGGILGWQEAGYEVKK